MSGVDLDSLEQIYKINELQQLPLNELRDLYKRAIDELMEEKIKYEEYELTSKEYELELETQNDQNVKRVDELEGENDKLIRELDKIRNKYENDRKELVKMEKENEQLKKQLTQTNDNTKIYFQKLKNLEIDNEHLGRDLRVSEQIIQDLEQKLDSQIEELALLQSELEEYKSHSQEQLERLKQQLDETNTELQVKERDLKKLKLQKLMLETNGIGMPHQQNKNNGSFIDNNGQNQTQQQYVSMKTNQPVRLSQGKTGNVLNKLTTHDFTSRNSTNRDRSNTYQTQHAQTHHDDEGTDMFERADHFDASKRPESARYQQPGRSSLLSNSNIGGGTGIFSQTHQNFNLVDGQQSPVKEEQDSTSKGSKALDENPSLNQKDFDQEQEQSQDYQQNQDSYLDESVHRLEDEEGQEPTHHNESQEIKSVEVLQVEDNQDQNAFNSDEQMFQPVSDVKLQFENEVLNNNQNLQAPQQFIVVNRKSNTFIDSSTQQIHQIHESKVEEKKQKHFFNQENLGPYINGHSYGAALNLMANNEFDDNLLTVDLDIEELLECDDIEQTAFINSSKQLLSVIDNVINCIDDRINSKRHNFYGNGANGYYANANAGLGYAQDEYGLGSFSQKNAFIGMNTQGGYHKHQSQSTYLNMATGGQSSNKNLDSRNIMMRSGAIDGRSTGAADNFDKTRKISVLY